MLSLAIKAGVLYNIGSFAILRVLAVALLPPLHRHHPVCSTAVSAFSSSCLLQRRLRSNPSRFLVDRVGIKGNELVLPPIIRILHPRSSPHPTRPPSVIVLATLPQLLREPKLSSLS
ncbi:hypothetical protein CGCSCA5_v011651 [Colletotrichum siamense]|nr:hypothetical protein CGCSCA5_v011651 [Colletotrichum siamense]